MADASWAYSAPSMFNLQEQTEGLIRDKQRQQQIELQNKRQIEEDKNAIAAQVNRVDVNDYLTSDGAINEHISSGVNNATQNAFAMIQKGADMTTVLSELRNNIVKVGSYSNAVKTGLSNIDKEIAMAQQKFPSADPVKLRDAARRGFLYNQDGSVKTDYSQFDLGKSYVNDAIQNRPGEFVSGTGSLIRNIRSAKMTPVQSSETNEFAGKKVKVGFKGQVSPWETIDVQDGTPRLKFKTESINLPRGGGAIEMLDREGFDALISNPNDALEFKAYYQKWRNDKGLVGEEYDQADDQLQRMAALELLGGENNRNTTSYIAPNNEVSYASFRDKQQAGVPTVVINNAPKIDTKNPISLAIEFMNDNSSASTSFQRPEVNVGGKSFYDMTNLLSGMRYGSDVNVGRVLMDKDSKEYTWVYPKEEYAKRFHRNKSLKFDASLGGFPVKMSKAEFMSFMNELMPINGLNPEKATIIQGNSGNPGQPSQKSKPKFN